MTACVTYAALQPLLNLVFEGVHVLPPSHIVPPTKHCRQPSLIPGTSAAGDAGRLLSCLLVALNAVLRLWLEPLLTSRSLRRFMSLWQHIAWHIAPCCALTSARCQPQPAAHIWSERLR